MSRYLTVNGPLGELYLTRQQAHLLCEFGNPEDPYRQCSDTIAFCGVREWPTCDNLIRAGLIERTEWAGSGEGWIYETTAKGRIVLAALREMEWR